MDLLVLQGGVLIARLRIFYFIFNNALNLEELLEDASRRRCVYSSGA